MSIPSIIHVFESGINPAPTNALENLVRRQLEIAVRDSPPQSMTSREDKPRTLVSDIGDYLTQATRLWSRLTDNLVSGTHVEMAVYNEHEHLELVNHVSDLNTVVTMDIEHERLCKIRDLTEKFSRDVQELWQPDPPALPADAAAQQVVVSSFRDVKRNSLVQTPASVVEVDARTNPNQKMPPASQVTPNHTSPAGNATASDDSDDDEDEQFSRIDMDALKQRGKGSYYCPLGHRCDKGGVDKDGNLVLFDRNSSFAQHCNKHRKPWRCDLPGCPNPPKKRKFARRDGLERHKATVKHRVVT